MEQDKLYFKRNYSINPILHEHIHLGGEFTILEGQTWEQVAEATLGRVDEFVNKHFPHAFAGVTAIADNPTIPNVQVDKEPPKSLVEQIESCTELKVLESYRLIAKTNPECQTAYDNKLKELQK